MNLKLGAVMATLDAPFDGELKAMKTLAFVTIGTALLALGACHKDNQDAVQNAELNQPAAEQVNELANQAAIDANAQMNAPVMNDQNASENVVNPKEADEQNVSGM